MAETDLVEQLTQHKTLGTAPREELAWLASHGAVRHLDEGDVLTAKGEDGVDVPAGLRGGRGLDGGAIGSRIPGPDLIDLIRLAGIEGDVGA